MWKNPRVVAIAAAVVLIAVVALMLFWRPASEVTNEIDLVERFADADRRTTVPSLEAAFKIEDVTIDGVTRRSIYAHPHSRLTWTIVVPPDAWLETAFAMRPDSWEVAGDGAQFRVGVSEGRTYDEVMREYINPKRGDRRWFTSRHDLSAYEGREVKIIFNTDPGPPGDGNSENDFAVWGAPRIYSQR